MRIIVIIFGSLMPVAHNGKLIIERQGAVLQTGNKQGNQKYDNNRDFVKAHFDAQAIFKQYAKT